MRELRIIKAKLQLMKLAVVDARRELDRLEAWANGIIMDVERGEKDGERKAEGEVV